MGKQIIREIIADQSKQKLPVNLVEREILPKIKPYLQDSEIIVISGIRRCGKSTLLQQLRLQNDQQDYYLNFDDERLLHFTVDDFQSLLEVFVELFGEEQWFYFDEIQNIEGWERFVRRLHDSGNKVIVTGSNASMLSRELGSHLTGRYHQVELFPFSFREYLRFEHFSVTDLKSTVGKNILLKKFNSFMDKGGIPGYLTTNQSDYLKTLYEGILYRDIVARYNLTKTSELKELVYFCASNIGKEISFNKLKIFLGLGSATTVKDYFTYLHDSFLFFLVPKFSYSVRQQIIANKKIFAIDTALVQLLGFRFTSDHGRFLENIVFIELLRRSKEVFYHSDKYECDFILRENGNINGAIQVTSEMRKNTTREREFAGLVEAMTEHKLEQGMILTKDEIGEETIIKNGKKYKVIIKPVSQWLLE